MSATMRELLQPPPREGLVPHEPPQQLALAGRPAGEVCAAAAGSQPPAATNVPLPLQC